MQNPRKAKRRLPATLLIAALATTPLLTTAQANHAPAHENFQHSEKFLQHHGAMQPKSASTKPARLGVAIAPLSTDELDRMSLEYGVRVEHVISGSIAEAAGVRVGDIITDLAGRPAYSPERLQYLVGQAGESAPMAITRDGDLVELMASFAKPARSGKPVLGIRIQAMTDDLKEAFGATDDRGVLIAQVKKGSGAALAGLKAGDVVVSIDGEKVKSVGDVLGAVDGRSPGDKLALTFLRDRQQSQAEVSLGSANMKPHPHKGQHHRMYKHGMGKHGSRFHGSYGGPRRHCHGWKGQRHS